MKILFLTSHVPFPANCGDKIATLNTIKGLLNKGISVDVLSLYAKEEEQSIESLKALGVGVYPILMPNFYLNVIKGLLSGRSVIFSRFYSKLLRDKLNSIVANYDVVFAHHTFMGQYFNHLPNANVVKLIDTHVLEACVMEKKSMFEKNIFLKWIFKYESKKLFSAETAAFHSADLSFSYGEKEVEIIKGLGVKNIKYRPIGLDLSYKIKMGEASDVNTLAFFGDYKWYPNLDGLNYILTELFPFLNKKVPSLKLIIAGRNAPEKLAELARNTPNVDFLGEVTNIDDFLNSAGIVLCPIRVGGGVRLKVIESMAKGKIVLVNDISAEGILDKDSILIAEDLEAIVSTIKKTIEDESYRVKQQQRAFDYAHANHSIVSSTDYLLTNIKV